jgi:hypothetical protein
LTASDLPDGQRLHVVIGNCRKRPVGMDQTQKWVIDFTDGAGHPVLKPLILNVGNGRILAEAYGDDVIGKPVELFKEPTTTRNGTPTMGVRIAIDNGQSDPLLDDEIPPFN